MESVHVARARKETDSEGALSMRDQSSADKYRIIHACTVSVKVYNGRMITSFGDQRTADLFHGRTTNRVRKLPNGVQRRALNKLDMLNAAHRIDDLRSPPGNRLEALKGDMVGFHSIRVSRQWRIVFRWEGNNVHEVSLVDYH